MHESIAPRVSHFALLLARGWLPGRAVDWPTCYAVGGGSCPSSETDWVAVRVAAVMSIRVVCVYTVPIAVVLVVVGGAVPLVSDVQIHVSASVISVHISVIVGVLGRVVVVVVIVVHDWVEGTIFVHGFPKKLEVVL